MNARTAISFLALLVDRSDRAISGTLIAEAVSEYGSHVRDGFRVHIRFTASLHALSKACSAAQLSLRYRLSHLPLHLPLPCYRIGRRHPGRAVSRGRVAEN
jgi:hypothetical protein